MEREAWEAVQRHARALSAHVHVQELVYYLKIRIRDPPAGVNFSPLQVEQEIAEIEEFQDHVSVGHVITFTTPPQSP